MNCDRKGSYNDIGSLRTIPGEEGQGAPGLERDRERDRERDGHLR